MALKRKLNRESRARRFSCTYVFHKGGTVDPTRALRGNSRKWRLTSRQHPRGGGVFFSFSTPRCTHPSQAILVCIYAEPRESSAGVSPRPPQPESRVWGVTYRVSGVGWCVGACVCVCECRVSGRIHHPNEVVFFLNIFLVCV
jgi:hypothetical protein